MDLGLPALIEALSRPEAYPHSVASVEVHQTHISVVFLAGPFAYKIKKSVNLGFLDFTTLEKRKHFCEEEVRLNRRLAPQVYLDVVPICQASNGYRFGSDGPVVEWAVQMKRLPADAALQSRLLRGEVTATQIRALAERLAEFHRGAESNERIWSFGRFEIVAGNARENFHQAEPLVGVAVTPAVFERVRELTEGYLQRDRGLIEVRASRGMPRDTHGDLHLDHVYLFPEAAPSDDLVIIDCIEFSDRFRYADPVAELAFLAMDLSFHGRRDLAAVLADAYFALSGDTDGCALLPFYCAYRAVVRAKVEGIQLNEPEIDPSERRDAEQRAKAHWLLALVELETPSRRPCVVMIGGLPGSGKSTLARPLVETANFTLLQSDVVRKELAGVPDSAPHSPEFNQGIYGDAWTERTYAELVKRTESLLWQGQRALIDANFRSDWQRKLFFDAARRWGMPIIFIHCQASPEVVHARLEARGRGRYSDPGCSATAYSPGAEYRSRPRRQADASDADWNVYQRLAQTWEPIEPNWLHLVRPLDTSNAVEQNMERLRTILRQEGLIS
jgi:uncharacterized protein